MSQPNNDIRTIIGNLENLHLQQQPVLRQPQPVLRRRSEFSPAYLDYVNSLPPDLRRVQEVSAGIRPPDHGMTRILEQDRRTIRPSDHGMTRIQEQNRRTIRPPEPRMIGTRPPERAMTGKRPAEQRQQQRPPKIKRV